MDHQPALLVGVALGQHEVGHRLPGVLPVGQVLQDHVGGAGVATLHVTVDGVDLECPVGHAQVVAVLAEDLRPAAAVDELAVELVVRDDDARAVGVDLDGEAACGGAAGLVGSGDRRAVTAGHVVGVARGQRRHRVAAVTEVPLHGDVGALGVGGRCVESDVERDETAGRSGGRGQVRNLVVLRLDPDVAVADVLARVVVVLQPDGAGRRPLRQVPAGRSGDLDVVVDEHPVPLHGDAGVGDLLTRRVEAGGGVVDVVGLPGLRRRRRVHVGGLLQVDRRGVVGLQRIDAEGVEDLQLVAFLLVHAAVGTLLAGDLRRHLGQPELHVEGVVPEGLDGAQVAVDDLDGAVLDDGPLRCPAVGVLPLRQVAVLAEQHDAFTSRADRHGVEVDLTRVVGTDLHLDQVGAGGQLDPLPMGGPDRPVDGRREDQLLWWPTVDDQRHRLVASEGVRAVGVAKAKVVGPVHGHVDGEAGPGVAFVEACDEAGAGVGGVVRRDGGTAVEHPCLGFVPGAVAVVAGDLVEGVPGLGVPQLLTLHRCQGPWAADVHDPVGLQAGDVEGHGHAVGRHRCRSDLELLLTDARAAVGRRGAVGPLLDLVGLGDRRDRLRRQRLGVGQLEAGRGGAHLADVEGVGAVGRQLLQAVVQLAGLAPVARLADAADVERAVGTEDGPVDAGLEARGVTERRTLIDAVDLLDEAALQPAVGHVAEHHLAGEGAVLEHHRVGRRVADRALRQPQDGAGHRVVVERSGRVGPVVEERPVGDVEQLRRGQPVPLVVHHEQRALGTEAHAVGGAQAACHELDVAGLGVHADGRATVLRGLGVSGLATLVDGDRQVDQEVPVLVQQAEGELVEVAAVGPRSDLLLLEEAVAVAVGTQRGQAVALGQVDRAVDFEDTHGVVQPVGQLGDADLLGAGVAQDPVEDEQLAGLGVGHRAARADVAGGGDEQSVVGGPGEGRDHRLEVVGSQVHEVVVGVDRVEGQAVTGGVGRALAVLGAGGGDTDDVGGGGQVLRRDHLEAARTRGLPLEGDLLAAAGLEVLEEQLVAARRQCGRALGRWIDAVQAVVVDHHVAVEGQPGAVIGVQAERVLAVGRHDQVGDGVGQEVVGEAEVRLAGVVDRRHVLVDVGRLPTAERADLRQADATEVEDPQRDTRLGGRLLLRPGRGRGKRCAGDDQHQDKYDGMAKTAGDGGH